MEEFREKFHEQENEMHLLRDFVEQRFKGIESLSFQYQERLFDRLTALEQMIMKQANMK